MWEGNTNPVPLGGLPWEPPLQDGSPRDVPFQPSIPVGLLCSQIQTPAFKNLKKPNQNNQAQTKQPALPIDIPLTAVLAAWLGYEWTHSFSHQSFPLLELKSHSVSTAPAPHISESLSPPALLSLLGAPSRAHPCSKPKFPAPALTAIHRKPHLLDWSFPVDLINANPDTC